MSGGRPDQLALAAGLRHERTLSSAQFKGGRFRNTLPVAPGIKGNPWPVVGEYFFSDNHRVPRAPLPIIDPRPAWAKPVDTGLRATWLGHSTVLLEIDGVRVLTDPVFGERASPVSFAGPKRFHPTPVSIAQLPVLDAVLLSHDHYDHLCESSIRELARMGVPFVTSLGVGKHFSALGVAPERIHELDWWEEYVLPARRPPLHRGSRAAFLRQRDSAIATTRSGRRVASAPIGTASSSAATRASPRNSASSASGSGRSIS